MDRPLVSVIMPVKNGGRFLHQSLNSIINQDYPSVEIIVVDGQSTDNTEQIVRSFRDVKYFYQEKDPGIPFAKNLGLAAAKGEFVAFISHDDIWLKEKLSVQVDYMIRNKVQYTITMVKFFLEEGCSVRPGFNKELLNGAYIGKMPETLVAYKSLFDSIGVFSTEFAYMEDIDWFNRAELNNIPSAVINQILIHKRIHDNNVSYNPSKIATINHEIFGLLKKSIDRNAL